MADKPWYQQTTDELFAHLETQEQGLTEATVKERREKYGENKLTEKRQTTLMQKFVAQFKDFMIIVLIVAAIIAGLTGEVADALIILAVVILNAVFGVFQESKAEDAINSLREMAAPVAHVERHGQVITVKSDELVPGDIVYLEAGDIVPADIRLVTANVMKVEEAALTGESVPVNKTSDVLAEDDLALGDRANLVYMTANITTGRGTGVVVATGMQTEVGQIAGMIEETAETKTPLQENLNQLGKWLTALILAIAALVFVIGMVRGEETLVNMLLTAISLAVAAIPEGLPAIVTITLALGTQRMAKRHALIRKLPAVETLGSTDIIASDKTGTLTQNKMTVEQIYENGQLVDAKQQEVDLTDPLALAMLLNNDSKFADDGLAGDPTETALIQYYLDRDEPAAATISNSERVAEIPFDSERKLMSTFNADSSGSITQYVKGAPDQLLKRVDRIFIDGKIREITAADKQQIMAVNHQLATQALRVLAFAYKEVDSVPSELTSETAEQHLIFAGLVAMIDPERPEVAQAVVEAHEAGIRPIMITGDHRDTATAIAKRLGIMGENSGDDQVITGAELDKLSDEEFNQRVDHYSVYARVAPEHKVRIVNAWQKRGKVVAMTGDGVNDAPALKAADIGVGMGITGTEVSKGASDMVLADDNFSTIVVAVEEGRKVFANIQKALQYLLSANIGEVLTLFVMTLLGWQILAPVQILWINLVTDTFPAIALGLEPAEPNIMKRKPRGRSSNFFSGGVFGNVIYQGLLEGLITLGVYGLSLQFPVHASGQLAHADALTMAFATLGLIQLFHAFNSKSIHDSIFKVGLFKNRSLNWAILTAFLLLAVTIVVPGFNTIFHLTELNILQWGIVFSAGILMIAIVEVVKFVQRRFEK
ncbi:cation-transporting ATPase [Secundilactobacillus pentosiphilus]|uniref:P-type Ca(2+) transporter n=1 Tax=Secundilactobacillus pentosiphilus TaxID=1714682 RepID=A0A1Z5INR3_9LACO|nr:cation-translocating P-type ATPase [Secundilactobacillus pentosiphilus]GAX03278.1 cation-transporting ATPase [Secundilactobacillus pentosiphilus]GAX06504.1 cation-transporting ATPase [Secundilactobacillus pentosiphilus]